MACYADETEFLKATTGLNVQEKAVLLALHNHKGEKKLTLEAIKAAAQLKNKQKADRIVRNLRDRKLIDQTNQITEAGLAFLPEPNDPNLTPFENLKKRSLNGQHNLDAYADVDTMN